MTEKTALEMLYDISNKYSPLTANEEMFYMSRYKKDKNLEDRELLVLSNLRFAIREARKYPRTKTMGLEDYISEAIIGLIIAIDKYDILRTTKLITYAQGWIRAVIGKAMYKMSEIHFSYQAWMKMVAHDVEYEKFYLKSFQDAIPLIRTFDDGKEHTLELKDEGFEEYTDRIFLRESIEQCMNDTLTEREKDIIKLRFGWEGIGGEYTLEEVGALLGITRERVRQIELGAMERLRQRYTKAQISKLQIQWNIGHLGKGHERARTG